MSILSNGVGAEGGGEEEDGFMECIVLSPSGERSNDDDDDDDDKGSGEAGGALDAGDKELSLELGLLQDSSIGLLPGL